MTEVREIGPGETGLVFEAMNALRPQYREREEFVRRVDEVQRPQGYRLVGAFEDERVVAVAGFRLVEMLDWGRALYVDDLSTLRSGQSARTRTGCISTPACGSPGSTS